MGTLVVPPLSRVDSQLALFYLTFFMTNARILKAINVDEYITTLSTDLLNHMRFFLIMFFIIKYNKTNIANPPV